MIAISILHSLSRVLRLDGLLYRLLEFITATAGGYVGSDTTDGSHSDKISPFTLCSLELRLDSSDIFKVEVEDVDKKLWFPSSCGSST